MCFDLAMGFLFMRFRGSYSNGVIRGGVCVGGCLFIVTYGIRVFCG